jgi:hypothetical protein
MYFKIISGQQHIDLSADFVLTYDNDLITCQLKKAVPKAGVSNAKYIKLKDASAKNRLLALWACYKFISQGRKPYRVRLITWLWLNLSIIAVPLWLVTVLWLILQR